MSKRKKVLKGGVIYVESDSTERKKEKRETDDSRTEQRRIYNNPVI